MQFNQQKDIVLHLALQVKLQFFVEGSETNCREMVGLRHSRYKDLKEKVKTLLNLEGYDVSFFMCGECRDECKILSDCGKVMVKPIIKELAEEALVQMIDEDGFTSTGKSQSNTDLAKECKSNTERSNPTLIEPRDANPTLKVVNPTLIGPKQLNSFRNGCNQPRF